MLEIIVFCEDGRKKNCIIFLGESICPNKGKAPGMRIYQRFHFSSALKRMSCVVGIRSSQTPEIQYLATVKGAPEVLKDMVS